MAKIVIEIDDKTLGRIFHRDCIGQEYDYKVTRAIVNGTVLTKGHGRLIDADAILEEPFGNTYKDIDIAETIIEADKDGQDGR